ncbi:MAG: ABC transporter ATP-binding protein [Clostridia bacterium]|nr:ABC transporter ATP-binding protein [Clostridia bacterium]
MFKILKYLKPYTFQTVMAMLFLVLNNATTLILPLMLSKIINNGVTEGKILYIISTGIQMLLISLFGIITSIIGSYFAAKASMGFGATLRREIFTQVERLSPGDIETIGIPSLITRSTNDVKHIQDMIVNGLRMIIAAPVLLIGGAILAVFMNPQLSTVILTALPIIGLIVFLVARKVIPMFDEMEKRTDRLNQVIREKISGIRVIRAFSRTEYEDEKFDEASGRLTFLALKINRIVALLIPIGVSILFAMVISLVWLSTMQVNRLDPVTQTLAIENTVGDLQAFILYLIAILVALVLAATMFIMVPYGTISANRILEVLNIEPTVKDSDEPIIPDENIKGELEFRNVTFGYPDAENPILNNISFKIEKGETVAIIGSTGSGKSTLINLIPRFFDVTGGEILVDGVNIKDIPLDVLNGKIGFVPQKAVLFSGTVADNLKFGKHDATVKQIERALDISQSTEFVNNLPNKVYEMISQGGNTLSGGQKQRLAIARALIKNAEFFIFDDSFSAVDLKTDAALRKSLHDNLSEATVILVAQRIGTIQNCDKIIVLEDGKIVGIGKHRELLETCSVYREIADSQYSVEEDGGEQVG